MKKLIAQLSGVAIGVTWVLALTLKFWGAEFYKVIPAIFSGIILGLFIADHKKAWSIIVSSCVSSYKVSLEIFWVIAAILFLIYATVIWIVSLIIGVILSPFYILRQIACSSWSLLIALSITVGGTLGTVYFSYSLGLVFALGFFAILTLFRIFLPENYLDLFFKYRKGLPGWATVYFFSGGLQ